jgi:hypothetical protein
MLVINSTVIVTELLSSCNCIQCCM